MTWFLFILLNGAFFIRPGDLVRSADLPIYNILMIPCLLLAAPRIVKVLASLQESPLSVCVLGLVVAVVLSHLSRGIFQNAVDDGFYMVKIVAHFLLLIALVDTPARMRSFLLSIVGFTLLLVLLALLHYNRVIVIESLEAVYQQDVDPETGEVSLIPRLRSTGVFNDPNDLSTVVVCSMVICMYFFAHPPAALPRYLWLLPIGVYLEALRLTFSRGGLINLALSVMVLCWIKLGRKKSIVVTMLLLPIALVLFGGRMTRVDVGNSHDTSQERIQLWSEGLDMFRWKPLFGVGANQFADHAGLVAHNSFVHTFAELGFFGGSLFTGAFCAALWGIKRLGNDGVIFFDRTTASVRTYIFAMVCSYCAGLLSISRPYTITTYLLLGVAASYLRIAGTRASISGLQFDGRFVRVMIVTEIGVILFIYLFVRIFAQWGS
jgi:putative inorganic carbon (hco3(-)) transporter